MKVNEVPEKLYLDATSKCGDTVFAIKNNNTDIEYTRTDAFIEKACSWLENNLQGFVGGSIYIEDFRKYMEGE